jgi:hypothetical protein
LLAVAALSDPFLRDSVGRGSVTSHIPGIIHCIIRVVFAGCVTVSAVKVEHLLDRNSGIDIIVRTVPQLGQDIELVWTIKEYLDGLAEVAAKLGDAPTFCCPRRGRLWQRRCGRTRE